MWAVIALRHRAPAALLAAALCAIARIAHADCPEGTPQAACVLHEEGVALLTSARYEQAATKLREAIAAAPSARSYLAYSQSLEGQGKLALAYEAMVAARRLSKAELAGPGAKDPAKLDRAQRIKHKLGDLGGRIGFVWLSLPEGAPPQRLVSVRREGEDDLPSPLGRWIAVAAGKQLLIASLDDGSQVQLIANVPASTERSLAIPIAAPAGPPPPVQQPSVQPPPPVQQPPVQQPPPVQPPPGQQPPAASRPIDSLSQPRTTPRPLPSATLAIGMTVLSQGPELSNVRLGAGVGLFGLFERRVGRSLGLTVHADYVSHPTDDSSFAQFSGFELMALAGLRTMTRIVHARIEMGVTRSTIEAPVVISNDPGRPLGTISWTDIYPVIGIGGGLHVGRFRLHASVLYASNDAAYHSALGFPPQMPIRFMGVLGVDLWRR